MANEQRLIKVERDEEYYDRKKEYEMTKGEKNWFLEGQKWRNNKNKE